MIKHLFKKIQNKIIDKRLFTYPCIIYLNDALEYIHNSEKDIAYFYIFMVIILSGEKPYSKEQRLMEILISKDKIKDITNRDLLFNIKYIYQTNIFDHQIYYNENINRLHIALELLYINPDEAYEMIHNIIS